MTRRSMYLCVFHCCPVHGCKYGHDDCRVADGSVKPSYPANNGCEICEREECGEGPWRDLCRHEAGGDRLYHLLALFDVRDGSPLADLVRSAREGWERSDPEMGSEDNGTAWDEFDDLWNLWTPNNRTAMARDWLFS